jgi:hypothetical protein
VADLSAIPDRRERERETLRLLSEGAPAISQGRLSAVVDLSSRRLAFCIRQCVRYVSGGSSTSCANRAANAERDIPTFDAGGDS